MLFTLRFNIGNYFPAHQTVPMQPQNKNVKSSAVSYTKGPNNKEHPGEEKKY
jgi:hypothetical protein